jgi:L-ribulose-5-phosphate 3-epimerase
MIPIGIMQGRLLPRFEGRMQAFPADDWEREFFLAREAGIRCIEWIYETYHESVNPLGSSAGIRAIRDLATETQVQVRSVCADYYMQELLLNGDGVPRPPVVEHLEWLITKAGELGVRYIVLPFVDASALRGAGATEGLLEVLRRVAPTARAQAVELHLETDWPAAQLAALLAEAYPCVRTNYDIGNSAALGHLPAVELPALARWLGSVHVKDRSLGGGTVGLGTGAADFATCFQLISAYGFAGFYILQAAREDGIPEAELAIRNRKFVEQYLNGCH